MRKLLVLEDEESIRSFIVLNLERAGYQVLEAATGEEALELIKNNRDISISVLDLMLPDIDGYEVCRRIRAQGLTMGIIMLTAKGQESDKVTGLMIGADDYVTKPFSVVELVARVDALFRRMSGGIIASETIASGPFELNLRSREMKKDGVKIELTQVEFMIIKTFMENPKSALSREDLLNAVWGRDYLCDLKIVDVNIRRLRLKIEEDAAAPKYITTLWGFGYKWEG
ncbi:MAG: response regulator transcription factor [Clostridiales bacterium]|nr:response regulator transcription factor [Clostridiales bacterium]